MKNILATFALLLAAIFNFGNLNAQTQKPLEKTLLWEVSGNGLQQPSYIFGTYHMLCKDDFEIKNKVIEALSKTKQTVLEINFSDPEQAQKMQTMMMSSKKLSEQYNAEDLAKLKLGLEKFGYKLEDIDSFSNVMVFSLLTTKFMNCDQNELKMLDMEILMSSMAGQKTILGLETVDEQAQLFEEYLSPKELLKLVEDYDKGKAKMDEMQKYYLSEDLEGLETAFNSEDYMTEAQRKIMLDNRNLNWAQQMPQIMSAASSFFAVGAGHLVGENGLINLLREAGYTVSPVMK